ncbi:MAG TPA: hypothetical protein VI566_10075 [Xanthomonadales bacterium]|nr:hypothetical protein [Xanthomonadales bacterium]
MRARKRDFEVYSLSAIDLFASAMGAFIIISIILMPDYQKEVRSQEDLAYLEELAGKTQAELDQSEAGKVSLLKALLAAQTRQRELQAEEDIISSELETLRAQQQARNEQPPPPPPQPEEVEEEEAEREEVSFRFLGLKTRKTRILFMVDMNSYLADHQALVRATVVRAMDSLQPGYEFAILGFQQLDSGPKYHHWPADHKLAKVSKSSRSQAIRFLAGLGKEFRGSSSLLGAFEQSASLPVDAIVLFSDGLPNPEFNSDLYGTRLVRAVTLANTQNREIHTVTIGDYFKYQGTVEFMEDLARANSGSFLALAK